MVQLEENGRLIVREMLRQEAGAFARNDDDVGCVENLELEIQLKGNEPVQKNYISIPKPLYGEVKEYLEDLINRNWICKSRSAYSSPMVCVRKKDGSLRPIPRTAADSSDTRHLKWSGRQQMVYSSRSRKGLSPRIHGTRKSPSYCFCDPLGIVPME